MGRKMTKRELLETFDEALREGHIYPVYQAQINHSTKRMVGAEALMRWNSPKYGTQYPSDFIPVLEKNDLLYRADVHMFESVCRFQRQRLDKSLPTVPISVNMSRFDIYHHEYADEIEAIRKRFDIPVKYLRIEITESAAIGGMELMTAVIKKLHGFGYVVEMDDFGSGYSSLNILKNLDVDIIKLDLGFLGDELGGRGGVILSTVVQMAKWLGTPLIAEGVETLEQADYMKSLGCYYMQGYLYAKPVPETDFAEQLDKTEHEPSAPAMRLADAISSGKFWSPDSMEELIFNNFIGAAALFTYQAGDVDILRVNENYLQETGMNMNTKDFVTSNPWNSITEDNRIVYEDTIRKAAVSGKEETCETWRHLYSSCCGDDTICIRSHIRIIGKAENQYLVYARVRNITAEKKRYEELYDSERRFRFASEQANVYAWEYTFATKEMRPCFRCMRDLHLPPVIRNYPEPLIKSGIFPQDYANLYRDWMRRLEAGEKHIEGVIPLTVGRIPFHIRYTTEFDENGKPLKAYGSATLVVDNVTKDQ